MAIPAAGSQGESDPASLAQGNAAPQRSADAAPQVADITASDLPAAAVRARGPHPLPLFLATVTRACAGDRARLARVLAGARAYQAAPDPPPRPDRAIVATAGGVTLRDHGRVGDPIVVVVPSVINPATVLDLAPGNSLLDALAAAGLRPLRVDWGAIPTATPGRLVEDHLLPLIAGLGAPVGVIGYCLGGTFAIAAAQLLGPRVRRLALLATPWQFGAYPPGARAGIANWWAGAQPLASGLGSVPIDLLQPLFWSLDEAGLADKYARLADNRDAAALEAFVRLEDWSNGGAPLPLTLATALFEDFFAADTPGRGTWAVGGQVIDPAALACPVLDIVAARDRLVPPAASASAPAGSALGRRELAAGHVGMIVGRDAPRQLWAPLAAWLAA